MKPTRFSDVSPTSNDWLYSLLRREPMILPYVMPVHSSYSSYSSYSSHGSLGPP